jgi:hypothetical protein
MSLKDYKIGIKSVGIYRQLDENEGPIGRSYKDHHKMDISDTGLEVLGMRQYCEVKRVK